MKGTEKQITWAEDIRKETLKGIDTHVESQTWYADANADWVATYKTAGEIVKAAYEEIFANADTYAGKIIDNRNRLFLGGANCILDNTYKAITAGKEITAEMLVKHINSKMY